MTDINIKKIKLEPGQMLLVQTCEQMTYSKKEQLGDLIKNKYPNNQVILCDQNYDFNVVEGSYIASYEFLRYLISSLKKKKKKGELILAKYDYSYSERIYNLLDAAPALLDALQTALPFVESSGFDPFDKAKNKIKSAIAKALG